jgi:hypothetical protein
MYILKAEDLAYLDKLVDEYGAIYSHTEYGAH